MVIPEWEDLRLRLTRLLTGDGDEVNYLFHRDQWQEAEWILDEMEKLVQRRRDDDDGQAAD